MIINLFGVAYSYSTTRKDSCGSAFYLLLIIRATSEEFLTWIQKIQAPPIVNKITAQTKDFPFSNSMSESTHSIYKTEFMRGKYSLNTQTHLKDLERFVAYYNYERYPTELYGYTTMEIIQGKIPDKDRFTAQILEAKKSRIEANQQFNDCSSAISCKP